MVTLCTLMVAAVQGQASAICDISKGNQEKDMLKAQQHKKGCSAHCSALPVQPLSVVFWRKQNSSYSRQQSLLFS